MAEVGAHAHPHDSRMQPNAKRGVICVDELTSPVQSGEKSVLQPTREQCGECVVFIYLAFARFSLHLLCLSLNLCPWARR